MEEKAMKIAFVILLSLNLFTLACNAAWFTARDKIYLFIINAKCGCFPWSPKVVPYKPGMTLCPGQTAIMEVNIKPIADKQ